MSGATYSGPERRWRTRIPRQPLRVLGRARVRHEHAQHALSLEPGRWYLLIEQPPDMLMAPLEGYVWIDVDGRSRSVWSAFLEVDEQGPRATDGSR